MPPISVDFADATSFAHRPRFDKDICEFERTKRQSLHVKCPSSTEAADALGNNAFEVGAVITGAPVSDSRSRSLCGLAARERLAIPIWLAESEGPTADGVPGWLENELRSDADGGIVFIAAQYG